MDTKHTPGPWYILGEDDYHSDRIDDFMICAQVGPERHEKDLFITNIGAPIQLVHSDYGEQNLANARLIAAAPDLLAAAQSARISIQACEGTRMPLVLGVALSLSLKSLLAAIAKAEGR